MEATSEGRLEGRVTEDVGREDGLMGVEWEGKEGGGKEMGKRTRPV
jgi:hypothetical protein